MLKLIIDFCYALNRPNTTFSDPVLRCYKKVIIHSEMSLGESKKSLFQKKTKIKRQIKVSINTRVKSEISSGLMRLELKICSLYLVNISLKIHIPSVKHN